jgi:ectoine hydroxylase-related dioxygenase (phytanoyl-CoA dioxygenase family)
LYSGGSGYTGPAGELIDHPAITGILNEILSPKEPADDYYNFRLENSTPSIRKAGFLPGDTKVPHNMIPHRAFVMRYQYGGGRIFSGLTRVVWELNEVKKTDGGTKFVTGSHKANLPSPSKFTTPDNDQLESYSCPPGSVFLFTESLLHASTGWDNPDVDRVSIFNCYNSLLCQYHRLDLPHEVVAAMPPKRQSLFRGVFDWQLTDKGPEDSTNRYYGENNRAL